MIFNKNKFSILSPTIMGICNVTKDSFSDGGINYKTPDALKSINQMFRDGAQIIDIGAESTRPGSDPISYKDEIKKISSILKKLPKDKFLISIDSSKIETQEFALENGAHIINDVFGGSNDLFHLTKKYKNGLVLMHTPAPPKIMQTKVNSYKNIIGDIKKIFHLTLKQMDKYNIPHSKIWFDPGIGFGKNLSQNLEIMQNIQQFKIKKCGIVLGSSRKSWISGIDQSEVDNRLGGSLASALYCYKKGVNMFRVHDVKETNQALKVYKNLCLK